MSILTRRRTTCRVCFVALIVLAVAPDSAISQGASPKSDELIFVTVGDPGNPPDSAGCGTVAYAFEMGKYEISNGRYCEFMNAVARRDDPYDLYSTNMENGLFGGIRRTEKDGKYHYEPLPGYADLPVVYVSWYDAARFCNWLHFGRPDTGESTTGTTEGDAKQGAYDTSSFPARGDRARYVKQKVKSRNPGARYWLPSLDEWIKAGFYDPTKKRGNGYWMYATKSDTKPEAVAPPGSLNSANYYDYKWAAPAPYLTAVGAYPKALSHYGTCDQSGNVWEWTETLYKDGMRRVVRGGAATTNARDVVRTHVDFEYPDHELYVFGFRVAREVSKREVPNDSGE